MKSYYRDGRILIPALLLLVACNATNSTLDESPAPLQSYSSQGSNFRLSLTDAPSKDLKSVFVNVLNAELWLSKGGKSARLIVAKNLGLVDLMTLRNGVLLPMQDIQIPEGATVTAIRLILGSGNYAIKNNGSICNLQTPSAQQSGIKIKLTNAVTIEDNFNYSLVVDFDAAKSVVFKGHNGCLLKPVLKVAGFTRVTQDQVGDDGGGSAGPGEDMTGGGGDYNIPGDDIPMDGAGGDFDTSPVIPDEVYFDVTTTDNMPPVTTDPSLFQE